MSFILTTERLKTILEGYDIPSSFSHFSHPVQPPFLIWRCPQTNNFNADNAVYHVISAMEIELYSRVDVPAEELRLETYLTENGIVWDKTSETWIDEEKVMMTVYEIS